jgi:hypothetical protein
MLPRPLEFVACKRIATMPAKEGAAAEEAPKPK